MWAFVWAPRGLAVWVAVEGHDDVEGAVGEEQSLRSAVEGHQAERKV